MLKRKYNRIFILLNGINEGLSENINGSCDIEIINGKGKLYTYVGGMGRLKDKERTVYLISAGIKGSLAIPAGKLESKGSNAVLETSFDPDNVFGSGLSIEDINTAAVWNSSESPTRAVLEGFVSHKVSWLKNLDIYGSDKPVAIMDEEKLYETNEATAEKIETKILEFEKNGFDMQEENTSDSYTPISEAVDVNEEKAESENELSDVSDDTSELLAAEAAIQQVSPQDTFRMIAEKFKRELDMLDELGVLDKTLILGQCGSKDNSSTNTEKPKKIEDVRSNTAETSKSVKAKSEQDILFEKNEKLSVGGGTLWVKADYREMYYVPSAIIELRKTFVKNGARNGHHIIAGRNNDKYYIGVPGRENQRDSAEKNGYYDFLSVNEKGNEGYWIKELES